MSQRPHPWWLAPAAFAGSLLVRMLGATWRLERTDAPEYTAAAARGERFVYAFWHCGLLPLAYARRGEGVAVLVSQHRDGELITRVIRHLGYIAARGSSTRGGDAGVRELLALAAEGRQLAITPDGPRGPSEKVKAGLVYVATRTGRRIVPIAMAARPAWVLRSWDRFRIPKPFARVRVTFGSPFAPDGTDAAAEERARESFERVLAVLTNDARSALGEVA